MKLSLFDLELQNIVCSWTTQLGRPS
jgi:hypothetical protein